MVNNRRMKTLRPLIALAAIGLFAAGCSSSSTSPSAPSESPMASESASPSESGSPIGGNVLPPIEIDGQKSETVKVGDNLNVITDGVTRVKTNNAEVLEISQPSDDGSAQFNAGAKVVGAGTAKLVVFGADGKLYTVTVTATQ